MNRDNETVFFNMTSVGFVLAHYSEALVLPTLRKLTQIVPNCKQHRMVFVANHENAHRRLYDVSRELVEGPFEVIRHDNTGMEFGAYQVGLNRLLQTMDADWIVIGNDTFAAHGNFSRVYRDRLIEETSRVQDNPAVIGRTHGLSRSYQLEGLRTHRWVQTSLFAINRAALIALEGRIYRPELESLVVESADMSTFFSKAVDPVLRHHLEVWLFQTHPGPHWYASEPLQSHNAAKMARKARSILQEKFVSAALEAASTEFINLNELSVAKKMLRKLDDKIFDLTQFGSRFR